MANLRLVAKYTVFIQSHTYTSQEVKTTRNVKSLLQKALVKMMGVIKFVGVPLQTKSFPMAHLESTLQFVHGRRLKEYSEGRHVERAFADL